MFWFSLISVNMKFDARYIVPSPHMHPSANDSTHFTCGACLRIRRSDAEMHLLSLFFGNTSSKAIRFSSSIPLHGVPSTSPMTFDLSNGGPYDMTPCSLPSRNAPKCRQLLFTDLCE